MELVERIPLEKINYLNSLSFKECKELDLYKSCKNEDERLIQFNIMKSFCQTNIKTRGETKRIYSYTEKTPLEVGGRLYCGNSIQSLPSKLRGFLLRDITTDIDMKNAHPVILKYLCLLHKIECPNLSYYIENRNDILDRLGSEYKTEFLKAVNNDKLNKKIKDKFFRSFDAECKNIQKTITSLECYKHIIDTVPSNREYNWLGSGINRILCVFENKILQEVISVLNSRQKEICALMFDGLMVYGNYYEDKNLLDEIESIIHYRFEGLKMQFAFKHHNTDLPDEFEINDTIDEFITFKSVEEEFEKNHLKIINKAFYVKEYQNDILIMTEKNIRTAYSHLIYNVIKQEEVLKRSFIEAWLKENKNQRRKDDMGVYPTGMVCPDNHYNLWRPFDMEFVTDYIEKIEERNFILNHIKILCGNDDNVTDYFIKWIAQMIQYPAIKTICPTLISNEGAGKGTLMRLLSKMLGATKILETTTPSRDVWGDFNAQIANKFLINLNELSKKETIETEGQIKGLITDPKITINNKGVQKYEIDSFHRFLITTNKDEPINTKNGDRRNLIIRSSDEKCGDKEYFKKMYKMLDDVNVIKTCYEYFKSIPDMDNFLDLKMPVTEYQEELKELSVNIIEKWLQDFTYKNINRDYVELKACSILEKFNEWKEESGMVYDCNVIQFMVRLCRLKINGVEKRKSMGINITKFDFEKLKIHFSI
jgi:hypothetical protein